jgi:hypothetical protein
MLSLNRIIMTSHSRRFNHRVCRVVGAGLQAMGHRVAFHLSVPERHSLRPSFLLYDHDGSKVLAFGEGKVRS